MPEFHRPMLNYIEK
jgi:hypothetical protein